MEISTGRADAVGNRATHLAQMYTITKGRRLRNDIQRWSQSTVTLRGGHLDNSAAHPDAGKIWSFGSHQQRLTDATLFTAPEATLRLTAGSRVATYEAAGDELWVVSSAGPQTTAGDPRRLEHGVILFSYLADAEPVTATCEQAEGRITLASELPCASAALASRVGGVSKIAPPYAELCYGGGWCDDPNGCV
jgi:hypothetical protein